MAGLKEPGTAGTSGCVVMFLHILVVGRQALVNHISTLRFLSHVFLKASTAPFFMYTGERDLTEVIRITSPSSIYCHITDKRTKKCNAGCDATETLLSALCALALNRRVTEKMGVKWIVVVVVLY